jgi:hypothetical protein
MVSASALTAQNVGVEEADQHFRLFWRSTSYPSPLGGIRVFVKEPDVGWHESDSRKDGFPAG